MANKTPLFDAHVALNGKMVDFFGWDMPLHYGSQMKEHETVRSAAGMFDVSHMTIVDILGPGARDYLRHLLANDVDKLKGCGQALYTAMLNDHAGIMDDLIVYFIDVNHYRLVVNSATREKDLAWINEQSHGFSVGIQERQEYAMVAVQGPQALEKVCQVLSPVKMDIAKTLSFFECAEAEGWFIARTGYTGEDGLEIVIPTTEVVDFWQQLLDVGVAPCGLGARDTLRLEAGLNLYGQDMDESVSPLNSNLNWTVAWEPQDRLFIGRASLELQKQKGVDRRLVGLVLEDKGVLRHGQKVMVEGLGEGEITSGTYSPTMGCAIALARIPKDAGKKVSVEIRGKLLTARVVKPPFVRNGKILVNEER